MHFRVIFLKIKKKNIKLHRILANKNQKEYIDENVAPSERLMKLLEVGYFFYSNVLEKLNK